MIYCLNCWYTISSVTQRVFPTVICRWRNKMKTTKCTCWTGRWARRARWRRCCAGAPARRGTSTPRRCALPYSTPHCPPSKSSSTYLTPLGTLVSHWNHYTHKRKPKSANIRVPRGLVQLICNHHYVKECKKLYKKDLYFHMFLLRKQFPLTCLQCIYS